MGSPMYKPSNRKGDDAADDRNGWKRKREGERQLRHGVFSLFRNHLILRRPLSLSDRPERCRL